MLGFYICVDMVDSWFFPVALFKRHQKVKKKNTRSKSLFYEYAFTTVVCDVNFNFVTALAF